MEKEDDKTKQDKEGPSPPNVRSQMRSEVELHHSGEPSWAMLPLIRSPQHPISRYVKICFTLALEMDLLWVCCVDCIRRRRVRMLCNGSSQSCFDHVQIDSCRRCMIAGIRAQQGHRCNVSRPREIQTEINSAKDWKHKFRQGLELACVV